MSSKVKMENQRSCDLCPKTFASRRGLYYHKLTHNNGEKKFNCARCNKSFNRAILLRSHLFTHAGEKLQKCRQCNYSTNHTSDLRQHIMKHTGEKPHRCNECNYTSAQANHMKQHTQEGHSCNIGNTPNYGGKKLKTAFFVFLVYFWYGLILTGIGNVRGELKIFSNTFIWQDLRFFVPGTDW